MGSLAERTALAGLVLLGGCVHYQARPIDPAQTAQSFSARRLDDPGLEAFVEANAEPRPEAWPPPVWDLGALTLAALHFHPDLDVARARWSVAQAGRATAGERPSPSVTAGPGYDTTTKTPTPWIPFIGFDIPIETAGKRGHRLAMAAHLSASSCSTGWSTCGPRGTPSRTPSCARGTDGCGPCS